MRARIRANWSDAESCTQVSTGTARLDIWLWAARFFRARSLARQAVEAGKVEVGGQRAKASRAVRVGDGLRIVRGEETFEVEVAAIGEQRGPATGRSEEHTSELQSLMRRSYAVFCLEKKN